MPHQNYTGHLPFTVAKYQGPLLGEKRGPLGPYILFGCGKVHAASPVFPQAGYMRHMLCMLKGKLFKFAPLICSLHGNSTRCVAIKKALHRSTSKIVVTGINTFFAKQYFYEMAPHISMTGCREKL